MILFILLLIIYIYILYTLPDNISKEYFNNLDSLYLIDAERYVEKLNTGFQGLRKWDGVPAVYARVRNNISPDPTT